MSFTVGEADDPSLLHRLMLVSYCNIDKGVFLSLYLFLDRLSDLSKFFCDDILSLFRSIEFIS
jgi:hypothetical protein